MYSWSEETKTKERPDQCYNCDNFFNKEDVFPKGDYYEEACQGCLNEMYSDDPKFIEDVEG